MRIKNSEIVQGCLGFLNARHYYVIKSPGRLLQVVLHPQDLNKQSG